MAIADKRHIRTIHALLAQLPMGRDVEFKKDLVRQYTNGREISTTGLLVPEAHELINDLRKMTGWTPAQVKANEKRRLIIHYARQMEWEVVMCKCGNVQICTCDRKADMERIDGWCVKYGQYHKALMEHTLEELSLLIVQFEKVYRDYLKSI